MRVFKRRRLPTVFPGPQKPKAVGGSLLALVPEDSPLRLVGQYGNERTLLVRGEIGAFALHWQIRRDLYPTVALASPCCHSLLWDLSAESIYSYPRWACHLCPKHIDALHGAPAKGWGFNVNLAYDYTFDWRDRLALINQWVDQAVENSAALNPLTAELALPDLRAVTGHFMDLYRHGVIDAALEDLKRL